MSARNVCRMCGAALGEPSLDLGESPLSNALVDPESARTSDARYPLAVYACVRCGLVQVPEVASPAAIFGNYAYFSSYSTTWLEHARRYAELAVARLGLSSRSLVVELASNDGYLLRQFVQRGIPVLGIEPAANVAAVARDAGVPTVQAFFGLDLAHQLVAQGRRADLIVADNVLAHVPDVNDFVAGIRTLLADGGVASFEFPHLLRTIERGEFDTVYHEHLSYFSLGVVRRLFVAHGLAVADVEELPTHGGSLRVWARADRRARASREVERVLALERSAGLDEPGALDQLAESAGRVRDELVAFLRRTKDAGETVAGYGAPAKATTLLNYCGIGTDLLPFTVDRSPHKQGKLIPGVRVPIHAPARIFESKPDYVLVLPWNLVDEIREQMADIGAWGGRFVVAIPSLSILPAPSRIAS